ncbi:lupeol synthase-like [Quercus suber]|uniref:lupeol synthase-like n=1 Tax=Quercus suber TaxID=58331 RepID=UPI0032DE384E
MWKLKIAEGGPELVSLNNFIGRQHWEFDPDAGTPEERAEVERMREEFKKNRFHKKQSADLLMRMQLRKENPCGPIPPPVQVKETEVTTEEAGITTLKRAVSFFSSIQAHDGHWPVESAGPLYFLQPMLLWSVCLFSASLDYLFTIRGLKVESPPLEAQSSPPRPLPSLDLSFFDL